MRRYLGGLGELAPYATWENANSLAQAGIIGKWDGNNSADREAIQSILGKPYGEWIETLRSDVLRSDSPLIQQDEKWRFVARGEAWNTLGNRISDADLDRFLEVSQFVLSERNPNLDLDKEERFSAPVYDLSLNHSKDLRSGIAETLALLGSRQEAISSCSFGKARNTADNVVYGLFEDANWERWASLDSHLPLLAEAAPDVFLKAVERNLVDLENSPFNELFAQESSGGPFGWNYMSGLLWALETLAWSPDYLIRVSVILSDLAHIDPGGTWANRPANSLTDIFLPWHYQTTAPLATRNNSIRTILQEHPKVGWDLLLSLLPHSHGSTSGTHRPTWRDFVPSNWEDTVTRGEYWEQIIEYSSVAISISEDDSERLFELLDRLADLPAPAQENLLRFLKSDSVKSRSEEERLPLWEKLNSILRHHRKFPDAEWAMPEENLAKIQTVADTIAPQEPTLRFRYLFTESDFDLYDEKGNYEDQRRRLDEERQKAVALILEEINLSTIYDFAKNVSSPYEVGRSLGIIATNDVEAQILQKIPTLNDEPLKSLLAGYVWARYWERKWDWVDSMLESKWDATEMATFLTLLPFDDKTWNRVNTHLAPDNEGLYWRNVTVNPYGVECEISTAIDKLLEFGRPIHALVCVAKTARDNDPFDVARATNTLLQILENPDYIPDLDSYTTIEVIKKLQESDQADRDALFKIEWAFLPWLDKFSSGAPLTLEEKLSTDPHFFAEVISFVFRPRSRTEEDEIQAELSEETQIRARNAFKLLHDWRWIPGKDRTGKFDPIAFKSWITEAISLTSKSGHIEVAKNEIGQVLTCAPPDPDDLWIHRAVAAEMDKRDNSDMRTGFTIRLFNNRGAFSWSGGEAERELAQHNRNLANQLESAGFSRFATAMRDHAASYDRQAERDEHRDPMDD